jgi:hypothetical protein
MNRKNSLDLFLVAALAAIAMLALPALAAAQDRNHDRIPDRWEKRHNLSLQVKQAGRDQDRDSLRNRAEFLAGDNPRDRDSDDDGVMDGEENAGTIQSFDAASGKLTIALFGGDTISGLVTEQTEVKCEGEGDNSATASDSGEEEPGDDNGDDGEEAGDDNGGDNSGPGSSNSGPGKDEDNEPGDDNGDGPAGSCTAADLVAGAVVQEAELKLKNGAATFEEVELAG